MKKKNNTIVLNKKTNAMLNAAVERWRQLTPLDGENWDRNLVANVVIQMYLKQDEERERED